MGICRRLWLIARAEFNAAKEKVKRKIRESELLKDSPTPKDIDLEKEYEELDRDYQKMMDDMKAKRLRADPQVVKSYRILGLDIGADLDTVTKRWKELSKKHHPDLFPDPAQKSQADRAYRDINQAYQAIKASLEKK